MEMEKRPASFKTYGLQGRPDSLSKKLKKPKLQAYLI